VTGPTPLTGDRADPPTGRGGWTGRTRSREGRLDPGGSWWADLVTGGRGSMRAWLLDLGRFR
jgi:hypothetical protein